MEDPLLEFRILEMVHDSEKRLTQRDISQKIGCSISSVNFALRLLAVKGFVKISGMNPRRLHYHLTPRGVVEKTILAYNFLKRQKALYEEARREVLAKLDGLAEARVHKAAIYGWTPLTEACLLYLISEGIEVTSLYVSGGKNPSHCNRIECRPLEQFQPDCEVLILLEPLPEAFETKITATTVLCYPTA